MAVRTKQHTSELRVMQITPKSYGVFLRKYLLKKFRTKAAAESYVRSIRARRKTNPAGNELGVEFGDTFRLKHGKGNIDVMVWNVQKNRVKLQRLDTGELVFWPWKNFNMIAKKYGSKINPSASQMAKAAIAVFDSDFDLDLDGRDVARLRRGEKRMRKAKQTKANPAKGYADAIDNYRTRPSGTPIVLFDSTPDVLVRLGVANKPLVLSPRKIAEILKKHRLVTLDVIKTAVSKLAEPVMVFRSATRPKSLVLVTDQFPGKNGKPVIAAIEISPNAGRHLVTSVYVKTSVGVIGSWIKSGLLRFINKRKSVRWFQLAGLQLPMSEIIERYAGQKPAAKYRLLTEDGPVKQNPINPIMAFAAGASGILSALQIKEHLARNTVEKAKGKTMAKAKAKANPRARAAKTAVARSKANPKKKSNGVVSRYLGRRAAKKEYGKELRLQAALERSRKRREAAERRAKGNPRPSAKAPARKKANPPARRRTYEMFQGRPSTTAKEMPVSRFAPARLDQLGDLIELKLADGQIIKPNPQRFKLCAAGGRLWIVGGKFAKANPAGKTNELNPIARIVHVVYGTRKPHHGDHAYTHYIHKLGEDTGHQPMLAVDREGFPVIRGGQYKIEARGIVN